MKTNTTTSDVISLLIISFVLGVIFEYTLRYEKIHAPAVELPEEYKSITTNDTLRGYFDSKGVLHIEFNNKLNK